MLTLYDLTMGAVRLPAFMPCKLPEMGWKLKADGVNIVQKAYRAVVSEKGGKTVRDTGWIESRASCHVKTGLELKPDSVWKLKVSVRDSRGEETSAETEFWTALRPEDWKAEWIRVSEPEEGWSPYMRKKFECRGGIARATLYISGLGCGEYTLNGRKVTDDLIDPPMTNYEREVLYRAYDVTSLIGTENVFVAQLGEGWYAQSRVWGIGTFKYGDCCLIAQLHIIYADGGSEIIVTDGTWKTRPSPVTLNNLYGGETYDCRLETKDINEWTGAEDGWSAAVRDSVPKGELKLCMIPAVREIGTVPAVAVRRASGKFDGAWIFDLGRNFAGIAEIKMRHMPRGAQVTFRFAETVNPDGTLDVRSTGTFATQCVQQDVYIARGDPEGEIWRPKFTYHAFRYVEVTGLYEKREYGLDPWVGTVTGIALSTALGSAGSFICADPDINRLQKLTIDTILSNYHGYPEDCPGREKCGWLGDAQIVCNTGIMNFDLEACYEKFLNDIRTTTEVYGTWQMISPGKRGCGDATPLWGCAQVLIPYWMYRYYGNERVVRDNWDLMVKWVEHEKNDARDGIITRGLGDWCPPIRDDSPRRMPVPESSTLMYYEICLRMEELREALSLEAETDFKALAEQIRGDFNRHFWIKEKHRYSTWGTCGVALVLGIYPEGEKQKLLDALLLMMAEDEYAMPTGIYGNKYLVKALDNNGYADKAMRVLLNRSHASFGTMLDQGATSVWERIDMKMIGHPREQVTSSYNHPMHTGFMAFCYEDVAGLRPLKPGYEEFEINPCRFEDIPKAEMTHESPYGRIAVSFERKNGKTVYTIEVPVNTTCRFRAGGADETLGSGCYERVVS